MRGLIISEMRAERPRKIPKGTAMAAAMRYPASALARVIRDWRRRTEAVPGSAIVPRMAWKGGR
uniref:Uncharacterized protein n=1 Tax=Candidatus Kentrum sp. LPFa TaxID=2126335 RepID=A0A450X799_9GAMM|nr:MAG: hypothetical protein BECKLPF1236A_GA0070988_1001825 [Candidatus Kentron sp. LPFa]VFK25133.1 MAG: hypothetical protein BECKLPF1236C_GA0070990_100198 [Candidatus Kentron sp. LPFa]